MKRKIIQVACMPAADAGAVPCIIALADDGTLWDGYSEYMGQKADSQGYMVPHYEFGWHEYPGLPDNNSALTRVKE